MARLDALEVSGKLKERLVDFSVSNNFLRNQDLEDICRAIWQGRPETGGLCSDVWVEATIPSRASSYTLEGLAAEGEFSPWLKDHLHKSGTFLSDWRLHEHQAQALLACKSSPDQRPSVILSASTGAGKTESFLFPILSELAEQPRLPGSGCRAIILYPMNALVNDQVERLYDWLKGQTKLSVCHFTGETPENHARAERDNYPDFDDCRHRTRQRARGLESAKGKKLAPEDRTPPPDILITNYSMLEYMLCRPQDQVFFGPGLQAVVLDEAHLYTGTLAAEITLLLRRLYHKCGIDSAQVLQFATSATIGTGSEKELREFAATIFSKPLTAVKVVQGEKAASCLPSPAPAEPPTTPADFGGQALQERTIVLNEKSKEVLVKSKEGCERLLPMLRRLVKPQLVDEAYRKCKDQPARLLRVLESSPQLHTLDAVLRTKSQISLEDLTFAVWQEKSVDAVRATTALLGLASAARDSVEMTPLLPHRLHLMLRPADGIHVCMNSSCTGPAEKRYKSLGVVTAERPEHCPCCGHVCLAIYRGVSCGEECLAAVSQGARLRPPASRDEIAEFFCIDPKAGTTINSEVGRIGGGDVGVRKITECDNCTAEPKQLRPIESATGLVLSILAETLMAALPPLPAKDERSNFILPAEGRRLLAFSDSRAEAARLGPRLRRQHDQQLIRAAVVRMFANASSDQEFLSYIEADIKELENKITKGLVPAPLLPREQRKLEELRGEHEAATAGGTVSYWAEQLKNDAVLEQILDEDLGERHQPGDWKQRVWEQNSEAIKAKAEDFLANEVARLPRRHSVTVETIGAVEVVYPGIAGLTPPAKFLGSLRTEHLEETLRSCWERLLASACDFLRLSGAVTFGSRERDLEWQQERLPIGQWMNMDWFCGKTDRGINRRFATYVLSKAGVIDPEENARLAKELLAALFQTLLVAATDVKEPSGQLPWLQRQVKVLENEESADSLQLVFPKLALRKPQRLYLCEKTGHVWPREILGCAPETGSCGTLRPASTEELDRSPFISRARHEYTNDSPVFRLGLWAEEHSAQLSSKETRRLQELFQRGMRNLLSATTTLELGIDIGGLSGAFLSNVPPSKASYLQRAGRVGRRADGSSIVVTCARANAYDREVFQRIGDFLSRPHREPRVFLERDRIARRHFHAWLMGSFFSQLYAPETHVGAMDAFGRMGLFCGVSLPDKWLKDEPRKPGLRKPKRPLEEDFELPSWWDAEHEDGLLHQFIQWVRHASGSQLDDTLNALFRGTRFEGPAARKALFEEAELQFSQALKDWLTDYDALTQAWKEAKDVRQANAVRYQLLTLYNLTVIETLSDARYLPRYGFPIGVHKLRVVVSDDKDDKAKEGKERRTREEDQFRLERSSLLALREYVPGSQLLVGGKLVTSRGLLKHWSGANIDSGLGLRGGATKCVNDHFYYWIADQPEDCPTCGEKPNALKQDLLFPSHGFTTAPWDPPKRSVDTDRVGIVVAATTEFGTKARNDQLRTLTRENFGNVPFLVATYKEEGEILVFNQGDNNTGFAICTACGYAQSEEEKRGKALPNSFTGHRPIYGDSYSKECAKISGGTFAMRNQVLAAREPTDVVMLDPSYFLADNPNSETVVRSLAVALRLAGARLLQLDSRELGHMVVPAGHQGRGCGAVVYDTVPGGAGHALELLEMGRAWLEATRDLLHGTDEHHQRCGHACLDCLMTFDVDHSKVTLDRRLALRLLEEMLEGNVTGGEAEVPSSDSPDSHQSGLPTLLLHDLKASGSLRKIVEELALSSPERKFALRLPTAALDREVPRGSWCEFRLVSDGEVLDKDAVVLASHPSLKDPELGSVTIRRMRTQVLTNADGKASKKIVTLSAKSADRSRYTPLKLELQGADLDVWRPLAVLERILN